MNVNIQNGIILDGVVYEFKEPGGTLGCTDCALFDECCGCEETDEILCRKIFDSLCGTHFVRGKIFIKHDEQRREAGDARRAASPV